MLVFCIDGEVIYDWLFKCYFYEFVMWVIVRYIVVVEDYVVF